MKTRIWSAGNKFVYVGVPTYTIPHGRIVGDGLNSPERAIDIEAQAIEFPIWREKVKEYLSQFGTVVSVKDTQVEEFFKDETLEMISDIELMKALFGKEPVFQKRFVNLGSEEVTRKIIVGWKNAE